MLTTLRELGFYNSVAVIIGLFLLCTITVPLRHILVNTARPRVRVLTAAGLVAIHILLILFLAAWLCRNAVTADQCFARWTLAFLLGCGMAVFQTWVICYSLPKRQLTEADKMKLKDL